DNGRFAEVLRPVRTLWPSVLDQELRIDAGGESADVDVDEIRRERQPLQRTPPFAGSEHATIGVLVGDFRLQFGVTKNMLFDLRFDRELIDDEREGLDGSGEQFAQ